MRTIQRFVRRLAADDRGASAVEYGLLIGLIAVASVAVSANLGTDIGELFSLFGASIDGVSPAPVSPVPKG